jgi:hypothetical protein
LWEGTVFIAILLVPSPKQKIVELGVRLITFREAELM